MFGANSTVARSALTKPAAPRPTASTSRPARTVLTASAMVAATFAESLGVASLTLSRILPCSSTTPAAIFVPPMSTPIVSAMIPSHASSLAS